MLMVVLWFLILRGLTGGPTVLLRPCVSICRISPQVFDHLVGNGGCEIEWRWLEFLNINVM